MEIKDAEVWKDVAGYEGFYAVSNLGSVKNLTTNKILILCLHKGYQVVGLRRNKKSQKVFVHRLVATAFIPNPEYLPCVNHKDEDKTNNNANNLEFCTQTYNINYGTTQQRKGDARRRPIIQKTKDGIVIKIYKSAMQAERETGISNDYIGSCVRGEYKTAGGFVWERQ